MIIVLKPRTSDENVKRVENMVRAKGLEVHTVKGEDLTIIGCIGDTVRRCIWCQSWWRTSGTDRRTLFCGVRRAGDRDRKGC